MHIFEPTATVRIFQQGSKMAATNTSPLSFVQSAKSILFGVLQFKTSGFPIVKLQITPCPVGRQRSGRSRWSDFASSPFDISISLWRSQWPPAPPLPMIRSQSKSTKTDFANSALSLFRAATKHQMWVVLVLHNEFTWATKRNHWIRLKVQVPNMYGNQQKQ